RLESIAQTDSSIDRTLDLLAKTDDTVLQYRTMRAIEGLDIESLQRRWTTISACDAISPHVRSRLEERRALAAPPVNTAWDRFLDAFRHIPDERRDSPPQRLAQNLLPVIARHPDRFAEPALAVLRDPAIDDWREYYCVILLGRMRHRPAIPLLIEKM